MDCFAWCVVCAHPHVCALPKTRVSPCELHAPAARHGPCAAARARCARPACVVRCLEVKQHNVTPPPCRPKLPVYEHQLNLKLVTSTSVKSLENPVKMHRRARRLDPYSPAHARFIPLTGCTRVLCRWGHRASPTTITRPELSASDVSAAELLAASRAAEQGRRSRRKVRRKASILPYLTLPRKKRKKERKIVLLVNYIRT